MNKSEGPKRHRPSQDKINLDVYFLPERLPASLQHPVETAGDHDALIRFDHAEGHLSPSSTSDQGWQVTLTICPPGEGHFMGIDLSIPEAKKLVKVLDYVIKWQKSLKAEAKTTLKQGKKDQDKKKSKASPKMREKLEDKKNGSA